MSAKTLKSLEIFNSFALLAALSSPRPRLTRRFVMALGAPGTQPVQAAKVSPKLLDRLLHAALPAFLHGLAKRFLTFLRGCLHGRSRLALF
jgi:hypothetical protein